ncbi:hypothetical protein DFH28DRAFT_1089350 [Melampsora americana]|nr:hypothetical protein DFH28DRAFT_1089350 [Melampsora americana]
MPTPLLPTGSQLISHLESMADFLDSPVPNTQSQGIDSQPTDTQQTTTTSQPATTTRKRPCNKTKNKNLKKKKTTNDHPPAPDVNIADIQAEGKTSFELRCLAEKHAQTGMSDAVFHSILKFHEEIETLIAIKALELGTTVSVIEEIFGKYMGVRRPSAWNGYLQSDFARSVFKEAGGVASGEAMRVLKANWATINKAEKETYRKVPRNTSADTTNEDLKDLGIGAQSQSNILQPRTTVITNARCLKQYKVSAERLLDQTLAKCAPIARANHFEMVIIAVSTHIGPNHFQLTRNTIGVDKALQIIYNNQGADVLPVQLQAYLVGKSPHGLQSELENQGRRFQSRVVNALSTHLYETTKLKHWPWSRCDATLAAAGYELKLLPGARSVEETFKTCSSQLNQAKLVALNEDLKDNLIQLVRIERPQAYRIDTRTDQTTHIDIDRLNDTYNDRLNQTQNSITIIPEMHEPSLI